MSIEANLAQFLLEKRKSLGKTQQNIADEIGVDRKTISHWERGLFLPVCAHEVFLWARACGEDHQESPIWSSGIIEHYYPNFEPRWLERFIQHQGILAFDEQWLQEQEPSRRWGSYLEGLRERKRLSQHQVSDAMGISRAAVGLWETGSREPVHLHTIARFLETCGVTDRAEIGRAVTLYDPQFDTKRWLDAFIAQKGLMAFDDQWLEAQDKTKQLAFYLQACRLHAGKEQQEIGHVPTLSGWETGERLPDRQNFVNLSKMYKECEKFDLNTCRRLYLGVLAADPNRLAALVDERFGRPTGGGGRRL